MASVVVSSPISFAAASFLRIKPFSPRFSPVRTLRCSLSTSSSSEPLEFDISFAPPKPSPPSSSRISQQQQLLIPWIVRGEDGNLKLQSQPPARLIHALADATTQNPKKKEPKKKKPPTVSSSAASSPASPSVPKLSKAARRYYNENFKEQPQRLSKVLAAAGGNPIHLLCLHLES